MEAGILPLELWRMILAYLPLPDLGRCSLVCRAWYELILSLDRTRWRQLYLGYTECRHPNWPNQPDVEPESWREAFKQHYLASKMWTKNAAILETSVCFSLFRRRRTRRTLSVGPGHEFHSLGSALAMSSLFDRILLFPGLHEEQGEIILKVPVEIVGHGKLGEVALLASIDQQCSTTRLCNLVFMPAWFSPFMFKTTSGHVQFDNCNFENGHIQVHGPGTCQVKFCTFKNTHVFLHNVPLCVLENCEFVGSENNSVTVEGHPSSENNWAYTHLLGLIRSSPGVLPTEDSDSLMSLDLESRDQAWSPRTCGIVIEGSQSPTSPATGSPKARSQEAEVGSDGERVARTPDSSDGGLSPSGEDEDEDQLTYRLSYQVQGPRPVLGGSFLGPPLPGASIQLPSCLVLNSLHQELQKDREAMALASSVQGCLIRKCLFRDGKGGVFVCSYGRAKMEGNIFRNLTYAVRCIHNSKIIMLRNHIHHCRASGIFLRLEGGGLIAGNNIYDNAEAGVDIRKKSNPLILCNQIHHGLRSGIVVLGNGKGIIRNNQIFSNKEAGIYILYHGNPVVSRNHIFKGSAAGIAVNENGRGLITENVIRENQWGGVDIRRGGVPILRSNLICFGYSDGVVVGDEGKGLLEGNTIYANKGCGVWMMSSSLPHVTSNHVSYNGLYGVAVFSQKDGSGESPGGHGAQENFGEDGDATLWETELEKDDDLLRRPITAALVESNTVNHNGASGLYVQSSEVLHVITNVIHANGDRGITVAQSSQLTRVTNNSISCNHQSGVKVEAQCKVEFRGNGIYDNRGHGIITKGDSTVIENDIIGNRGSGLQLLPTSDTKVIKNRIHSFRAYGIAVQGRAKALLQENTVFQGKTNKTVFQQISNNQECIMQNNKFLVFKKKSDTWRLANPPARPHLENSLRGPSAAHSGQKVTAMATRITAHVEGGYHSKRSIFCTIL
ncbi:F-box only protein 10 isoform X1 [Eubalaena glacialis]|uniref:F-box only protein 10 isoform X1 n=1 Tax=Eubalaena glacialis TaxID=27606 RepID=UPI002A5B0764|nr:F-box only protein 10 isoform X1 [Eubalaena glacialis]XP_061056204.1 F-box only protein 10 isoform X1 [Eubalaena glacialis]XP_061056205.1 F-box only protein 10 isoform X1 [Eubalaena glacialis]